MIDKKTTLKDMEVELAPHSHGIFKAELIAKLAEYGGKVSSWKADMPYELKAYPNLVSWRRHITSVYNASTKEFQPLPEAQKHWRRENTYMLYYSASDIFKHGDNVLEVITRLKRAVEDSSTRLSASGKSKIPRLMIMVDDWRKLRGATAVQKRKLEKIFVKLQMDRCSVIHVEGKEDAVTWLYNLTADLGMKQHK